MPYIDEENLQRLMDTFATVSSRTQALTRAFLTRNYLSAVAKEYGLQGVCRRLAILERCITQIYAFLPPSLDEVPSRDVLLDATIFIQAFVFNTFGLLDNLAFIWVNERNLRNSNGQPLPNKCIGFNKKLVRESFSTEMQAYLVGLDRWVAYLENFRHALAHRVPVYIPPHVVTSADLDLYQALESSKNESLLRGDITEFERLETKQNALICFRPWFKQSWEDPTPPVIFHAQVLADFATVEDLSSKVLEELNR